MQVAIKDWPELASDLEFGASALIDAYDLKFDKSASERVIQHHGS